MVFPLAFLQCSKGDVQRPATEERYVVNSILQPGRPVVVALSQTYSSPRGFSLPVTAASMYLFKDGGLADTLSIRPDDLFHSSGPVENGTHLKLEVQLKEGGRLTGEVEIPKPISLSITEADSLKGPDGFMYTYKIRLSINNPELEGFYLRYRAYPIDTMAGDNLQEGLVVEMDGRFDGSRFVSLPGGFKGELVFRSSRKLVHSFTAMSKELFLFYVGKDQFTQRGNDELVIPPVTPSNIEGGLGFFSYYQEYLVSK